MAWKCRIKELVALLLPPHTPKELLVKIRLHLSRTSCRVSDRLPMEAMDNTASLRGEGVPLVLATISSLFHTAIQLLSLRTSADTEPHTAFEMAQRVASVTASHLCWLPSIVNQRWFNKYQQSLFVFARLVRGARPVWRGGRSLTGAAPRPAAPCRTQACPPHPSLRPYGRCRWREAARACRICCCVRRRPAQQGWSPTSGALL